MLSKNDSRKALQRLFDHHLVADLNALCGVLGTHSRMSVFRRLQMVGYLSSYTHAGRYYTLPGTPTFDDHGLWFHQEIGFSRFATLRNTVIEMVSSSDEGMTHSELRDLLCVRIQDTLLNLVRSDQIRRVRMHGLYLYVNADTDQAEKQRSQRRSYAQDTESLSTANVIEILVEAIHASRRYAAPAVVAARLRKRGFAVSSDQVKAVFKKCGMDVEKKTTGSALAP